MAALLPGGGGGGGGGGKEAQAHAWLVICDIPTVSMFLFPYNFSNISGTILKIWVFQLQSSTKIASVGIHA